MSTKFWRFRSITGRITGRLLAIVFISILITSALGYAKLYQVTDVNAFIRIDRAARAAAMVFTNQLASEFTVTRDADGKPVAIRILDGAEDTALVYRDEYDTLLKDIGNMNQGAANLFSLDPQGIAFDRFATTFRRPDGSLPPPMAIGPGHPAFADLIANRPYLGEVPIMGRMRLASIIPIQSMNGDVTGALAVDVGWVDDLVNARHELRRQFSLSTAAILFLVAAFGVVHMGRELKPLRELAKFADGVAEGKDRASVPHMDRTDEIGALAHGLDRVVQLQSELAYLAYTDELTEKGNRSRYLGDLRAALAANFADGRDSILMHIDVDNFKQINDAYGQETGDTLLKMIATRIEGAAPKETKIYRLTTDHFALLLTCKNCNARATALADALDTSFGLPFQAPVGALRLTASIGITCLNTDAGDVDEAHRNAGLAVRTAKANGGDQTVYFSSEMNDAVQEKVRIEHLLQAGIRDNEIEVYFQPQIQPSTGALEGIEVLARWFNSDEGAISPAKFIPIAESSGLIVQLGNRVLDLACAQAAKWHKDGFDFKHLSVNVSPTQLWQPDFVDVVKETLQRHNIPGRFIYIEITESIFVDHSETSISKVLAGVLALGVKLSLDDFGTGYSSLGYLNRLPFDQLKIDRCFVTDIDKDQGKRHVLRGILELARGLGFDVVVEGAETSAEVSLINEMGCDSIQGFFYAKPSPASLIPDLTKTILQSGRCLTRRSA